MLVVFSEYAGGIFKKKIARFAVERGGGAGWSVA
jgi:hypothetical protein